MKKISSFTIFLICAFALLSFNAYSQAPNWLWAKTSDAISLSGAYAVCIDGSENTYVAGNFGNPVFPTITFGAFTLTTGGTNTFLVKYDPLGNVIWATSAGGDENDLYSICADHSGNVFITGHFSPPTITFDTITLTDTGYHPIFLAKYNSSGNVIWAKKMGGNYIDNVFSVTTDFSGNSYLTGDFNNPTATFGSIALTNTGMGGHDAYIVKYDPLGNALWARGYGGNDPAIGYSVATDTIGNCYMAGYFSAPTITFGSNTLTNNGSENMFLAKFDPSGNVIWAKSAGGVFNDSPYSISTDPSGNCYVLGEFSSPTITFGSTTLTNSDNSPSFTNDIFLAKYDPSGNVLWAKGAGGNASSEDGKSAFADNSGCYITGVFYVPTITFGSITLTNSGTGEMYLVKYDPSGNVVWAKSPTGGADEGYSVAADASGNSYVAGGFGNPTLTFGATTLTLPNGSPGQMFIAKTGSDVGINSLENSGNGISIFPNPVTTSAVFHMKGLDGNKTFIIYDQLGREIWRKETSENQIEFSAVGFADGMYFYKVDSKNNFKSSGKFIVQH